MSSVSINELKEQKENIEYLIAQFNQEWPQYCTSAKVWDIPMMTDQVAPDEIAITPFTQEAAIDKTITALSNFEWKKEQHPATVKRLPGIIRLTQSCYAQVSEINARKDDLRDLMHTLHPRTRPKYAQMAWPYVSSLQLYRHIAAPYSTKRKVLFSWVGHTTSSTRTTRDKMIETVKLSRALVPAGVSINNWNIVIDKEIELLASLASNAHLVLQKRVAPHPRAMVYHNMDRQPSRTYGANLPLFIPDNPNIVIRELNDWSRKETLLRKQRKDKLPSTPLISRIYLYLRES